LAKIAPRAPEPHARWLELDHALALRQQHGTPGHTTRRMMAAGDGWTVADVLCTCSPDDRSFEEEHDQSVIAVVLAGTFQYRSALGLSLMTPGSLMLGNRGQSFECGHAHGSGDRCVSFWYAPEHFERLSTDSDVRPGARFTVPRLPPLRALSPLVARAALGLGSPGETPWDELSVAVAASALRLSSGLASDRRGSPLNAEARVAQSVRTIDRHPAGPWTLAHLADAAALSPYHFLRTFNHLTGVTPHQYVLRARLRDAAVRLVRESGSVLDIALDCGFGDISNFNRAFRSEFGVSPRAYRREF
jgi:AraC family transcriptional regulator